MMQNRRQPMALQKAASIAKRSLTPNRPHHAQWMVTRKCNYRCRGCNVWREQDSNELSTEEIKKGLDVLKDLGIVETVLSGGNPLLRDDMKEIVDYASRSFITTVYDNGSMAGEKMDMLRNANFVAVSIDSLDPRKNDYIKGVRGAWKRAMQTVEKLHNNGIHVSVTPTISQLNLYEIGNLTEYFLKKGIPLWYCIYSYDAFDGRNQIFKIGRKNDEFVITDREAMVNVCDYLIEAKKRNSNILMTTRLLAAVKSLYSENRRNWKCRALQNFLMIDHMGRVAGCHVHDPVCSVFDLPKAWDSDELNTWRNTYGECTQCSYLCYIFYSLHGTVLGNLQIAQERWKSAKLLLKKNNVKPPDSATQQ